jgi:hypothetical protein
MFRISLLLWLNALAALNLTLLKYSEAIVDVLIGTLLAMLISGPLIALTFVLGDMSSRFGLEITRREAI